MGLQKFTHDESDYERPGQKWVCGRLGDGCPCACGPKPSGRCSQSENPCRPQSSLRRRRNRMALLAFAASGLLAGAALLLQNEQDPYISPGDLSYHHGTVRNAAGTSDCRACHDIPAGHGWLEMALTPKSTLDHSQKCLVCHFKGDSAISALKPHGIKDGHGFPDAVQAKFDKDVACSTCHVEHKGLNATITQLSNTQCQTCHEKTFASFGNGHPEFTLFPYATQASIKFDHQRHLDKNAQGMQMIGGKCSHCHDPAPAGRMMVNKPFAQTCAPCHLNTVIFNTESAQLTLLKLNNPGSGSAASLTPLMRVLAPDINRLAADEKADPIQIHMATRNFIYQLQRGMPLAPVQAAAAQSIFSRLSADTVADWLKPDELQRSLFYYQHAQESGQGQAWVVWLLASRLSAKDLDAIEEQLVRGFWDRRAQQLSWDWRFFDLAAKDEKLRELVEAADKSGSLAALINGSVTAADPGIDAIVGRLKEAPAKDVVALIASLVPQPVKLSTYEKALKKELDNIGNELTPEEKALSLPDLLAKLILEDRERGKFRKYSASVLKDKDKKLYTYLYSTDVAALEKEKVNECLKAIEDNLNAIAGGDESKLPKVPEDFSPAWSAPADAVPVRLALAPVTNWRVDTAEQAIVYASTGHADPVLKAIQELAASASGKAAPEVLAELVKTGQCNYCHLQEIDFHAADRPLQMNWVTVKAKRLQKFNHARHKALDCQKCHQLGTGPSAVATEFPGFKGSFEPMQRALCAECHQPQKVGDSCLKCHNYHPESLAHDKLEHDFLLQMFRDGQTKAGAADAKP